jgi:hypothetical protein
MDRVGIYDVIVPFSVVLSLNHERSLVMMRT